MPADREEVVMFTGAAATAMLKGLLAVAPEPSVTWTVKAAVPMAAGVPAMVPAEDRVKPAGNDPELMDQV